MKASKVKKKKINCPSCGAPVTMEICPYCGVVTGLNSAEAEMEYPVLECKEVVPERSDTFFSLLISFIFIVLGIGLLILFLAIWKVGLFGVVFSLLFLIPGICSTAEPLRKIFIYLRVKAFGKKTQATVYGYLDDENGLSTTARQKS